MLFLRLGLRLLGRVALCFRVYCLVFDLRFNLAVLVGWCVYVWVCVDGLIVWLIVLLV